MTKIPATKPSRIVVDKNYYKLEPAISRTHYGEHGFDRGGQPYAFPAKQADDAWFVISEWNGTRHGVVQQWNDGEWTFSKITTNQATPNWLRPALREAPSIIYNLSSRLYSGSSPQEAIGRGLGLNLPTNAHATRKLRAAPARPPRSPAPRSKIQVGDCVTMREAHRKFITSSTGGAVFKVLRSLDPR